MSISRKGLIFKGALVQHTYTAAVRIKANDLVSGAVMVVQMKPHGFILGHGRVFGKVQVVRSENTFGLTSTICLPTKRY